MTKEKYKSKIFNPYTVLIQSIIPLISLVMVLAIHCIPIYDSVPDFLKTIYTIFLQGSFYISHIYPLVSILWCIANLIYCVKKKSNRKLAGISFSIAFFILVIDLYFSCIFYLIGDVSI